MWFIYMDVVDTLLFDGVNKRGIRKSLSQGWFLEESGFN